MFRNRPGWKLKIRIWVHHAGEKVLGPGRIDLLGHIDRLHSISAAAREMDMSYRRAWGLVRSMNDAAGQPLVAVATGGSGGGGAALTARGREALDLYQKLARQLERTAAKTIGQRSLY
jgi:molybdate transport system regulatory protein